MASGSLLLSSPARPTLHDRFMMLSSSPDLPSLEDLIAKKLKGPPLRSGSAAAPIPEDATTTFTSAASLLRTAQADKFVEEPMPPPPKPKRVRKAPKKTVRVPKDVIELSSDGLTPLAAKGRRETSASAEVQLDDNEGTYLKSKPWKKYRASPQAKDTQTALPKEKVTKAPAKAKAERKKAETVSKHFAKERAMSEKPSKEAARALTPEPMNLEPALQRRMDWTPRPDAISLLSEPAEAQEFQSPPNKDEACNNESNVVFKTLHDTFGHQGTCAESSIDAQTTSKVLGKRKVIDMISVNQASKNTESTREPPPVKTKAPKKKPRTITELATAAYAPREDEPPSEPSLLNYFGADDIAHEPMDKDKDNSKGKGKAARPAKVTKKKAPPKRPILLSPESALKQSSRQDFVFGTSSQLVREKSPTMLRDLQAAIQASNIPEEEEDPFASSPLPQVSRAKKAAGKGLWSVSARDDDGELLDVEIINLVGSALSDDDAILQPILDPWNDLPPEPAVPGAGAGAGTTDTADSSVVEIISSAPSGTQGTASQNVLPKSHFFMSQAKVTVNTLGALSESTKAPKSSIPLIADLLDDNFPPPSNQEQSQDDVESNSILVTHAEIPRPKYELYTDMQLAREISKFGFKAIKKRTVMIALLDQCWESKKKTAARAATTAAFSTAALKAGRSKTASATSSTATSPAPKKPRGRPKKDSTTSPSKVSKTDAVAPPKRPVGRPRKDSLTSEPATSPEKPPKRPAKNSIKSDAGASPTKPKARPRKKSVAATETTASSMPPPRKPKPAASTTKRKKAAQPVDDIPDSDLDSDASELSEQIFSSPAAVDLSITDAADMSLTSSPTVQQTVLFSQITKAVTSAPRTADPLNPSWHEKMLMYDPVILEDLATWLNSGELTRVGHDDEVSPLDVKKWCESKSICWIWKATHRGTERKRV